MAEPIDNFIPPHRGRPEQYPYDDWFDGRTWLLESGKDFQVPVKTMIRTIRKRADRRGFECMIHKQGPNIVIAPTAT